MNKIFAIACCFLVLVGCGSASPASSTVRENSTNNTIIEAEADIKYQDVHLGNYVAKIPADWTIVDEVFFLKEPKKTPFITCVVIDKYQTLDEMFSYTGAEEEFMEEFCKATFKQYTYSHSDMEKATYGDISALRFISAGKVNDTTISITCNLFNNPGGEILAVSLYHDKENVDAIHDYLQVFFNMAPSDNTETFNAPEPSSKTAQENKEPEPTSEEKTETENPEADLDHVEEEPVEEEPVEEEPIEQEPIEQEPVAEEPVEEEPVEQEPVAEEPVADQYSPTPGEQNALASAKRYINYSPFSYSGLIDQLKYEGFTDSEAAYGADNCGADWYEQALKSAEKYLNYSAFSYSGLIEQLEYEGYTEEEASYGVDNCGADWNEQAAKKAQQYLDYSSFSRSGLIDQLKYEGFTPDQAEYGVSQVYN